LTGYDPAGLAVEFGAGDMARIGRLCHAADKLQSKMAGPTIRKKQRYHLRRALLRVHRRIRSLVDDLHRRTARWLCQSYDVILLPEFESQRLAQRGPGRRINSKTARAMLTWSHYRFRQFLQHKTREFPCVRVQLLSEAYTSKTCGRCGVLNQKLGGNKTFRCASCGLVADRDVHAARNILMRGLVDEERRFLGTPR
jgi:putative transposase